MRQHILMETITYENRQVLSYVNWFLKANGKTLKLIEDLRDERHK